MNAPMVLDFELDGTSDVDPVEEMRLRTWARKYYCTADERDAEWHPVVLEEMIRKDREATVRAH